MPRVAEFVQLTLDLNVSSIFYFPTTQETDFTLYVKFT